MSDSDQVDMRDLRDIFVEVDTDGDGKFSALDFLAFMEKRGIKLPRKLLAGIEAETETLDFTQFEEIVTGLR